MDALRFLRAQHDELRALFTAYARAEEGRQKHRLFLRIADLVAVHDTIEERLFYPMVFVGPLKDMLRQSVEEHLAAKRTLADLLDMRVGDAQFDAKMRLLEEVLALHFRLEETTLFPMVRGNFTGRELAFLGEELQALAAQEQEGEPRRHLPEEIAEAAPLD